MADTVFGTPLEEGTPEFEAGNEISNEGNLQAEDYANQLYDLLESSTNDDRDFRKKYNTVLTEEEELGYNQWAAALSDRERRDVTADEYDYDIRGLYKELGGALPEPGHGPDTYKKPNHPTFSEESVYSGTDGFTGGRWNEDSFDVGESNLYSPNELKEYFAQREEDIRLIDKRVNSAQTAGLISVIDQGEEYGKIMSDAEAYVISQRKGAKTLGEVWREKTDLRGGDNVIGKTVALGIGGFAAKGAAFGVGGGVPGILAGAAIGTLVGMGANAMAVWWSAKEDRDVRKTLLQLQADDYDDPMDRERDERVFASWYNEKRIDEMRDDPTFFGMAAGTLLDMAPYVAEVAMGRGAVKAGVRSAFRKPGNLLGKGAKEALEAGSFRLTAAESKSILKNAPELAKRAGLSEDGAISALLRKHTEKKVAAYMRNMKFNVTSVAPAVVAVQQPRIFQELKSRELASVNVDDKGNFQFDDKHLKPGSIARKEAAAYVEAVTEMYGTRMAKAFFKYTGVQAAMRPVVEAAMGSKMTKQFGELGTTKAVKKFFTDTTVGKSLTGKSSIMQSLYRSAAVNQPLEEMTEEYVSMTLSAVMGFDKDERGDMSYSQNLMDKVFFPVNHPKEAAAMMAAFTVLPAAAGTFSTLRGDASKEQVEQANRFAYKLLQFKRGEKTLTEAEFDLLHKEFLESESVQGAAKEAGKSEEGNAFIDFFKQVFAPQGKNVAMNRIGVDVRGFGQMVTAHEADIKKEGNLTGEAATKEATSRAVADMLAGGIIVKNSSDRKAFDEFRKTEGVHLSNNFYEVIDTAGGVRVARAAFEVDEKTAKEASSRVQKVLKKSPNIIYSDKAGEAPGKSNRQIGLDNKLVQAVIDSDKETRSKAVTALEMSVKKALGTVRIYKTNAMGRRLPAQTRMTDQEVTKLTNEIIDIVKENPSQEIVLTSGRMVKALTEEQARAVSKERGQEVKVGQTSVARAWNKNGKIYLTPLTLGALSPDKKSSAAILEEERIEANVKEITGGVIDQSNTGILAVSQATQELLVHASTFEEGTPEYDSAMALAAKMQVALQKGEKQAFEQYIEMVQSIYGRNRGDLDNDYLHFFNTVFSKEAKNLLEKSALENFDKRSGLRLDYSKAPARAAEPKKIKAGERVVREYLDAEGKAIPEKQRAIDKLFSRATRPGLLSEEEQQLAEAILEELLKAEHGKKGHKKIKARIAELHEAFGETSYSSFIMGEGGQSASGEVEVSTPDVENKFKQDMLDELKRVVIAQKMVERHGKRQGSRYVYALGRQAFFREAVTSIKAWNNFLNGSGGDFLERELRSIAKEGHEVTTTDKNGVKTVKHEALDVFSAWSFFRASNAMHIMPIITSRGRQGFIQTNRIQIDNEMHATATLALSDKADREELIARYIEIVLSQDEEAMYEFVGNILGVPSGIMRDGLAKKTGLKVNFKKLFVPNAIGLDIKDFETADREAFIAKASETIMSAVSRFDGEKDYKGLIQAAIAGTPSEMRYDLGYKNVAGKRVTAIQGDSHIMSIIDRLRQQFGAGIRDSDSFFYSYDGERGLDGDDVESSSQSGRVLVKTMTQLFADSMKKSGNARYLHNLGQFGEKGTRIFVSMPAIPRAQILEEAKKISEQLAGMPKHVAAMFSDPLAMIKRDPKILNTADIQYAINHVKIIETIHGSLTDYAEEGKSVVQNVFNVVKRASQELTDGIAYQHPFNIIYVDDFAGYVDRNFTEHFDGMGFITSQLGKKIAADLGRENMKGLTRADTFKGHISSSDGRRVLVKVNWSNMEMLASKSPEIKKLLNYVTKWNEANPKNTIDAIAMPSGAKFRKGEKLTDYNSNKPPVISQIGGGQLVRSQMLNHDSEVNHEGILMKQRMAHMFSHIMPNGRLAAALRLKVSRRRASEKLVKDISDKLVSESTQENIVDAVERGESLYDPRYSDHVFSSTNAFIRKATRIVSARVALQKVSAAGNEPATYGTVEPGDRYVTLPRARMNIKGARYNTYGAMTPLGFKKFKSKEMAIAFIQKNKRHFQDMFLPGADGYPDYTQVLDHEIKKENGTWVIPGDVVEETRVPSDNYTSHGFYRLTEPATEKAYESINLSATPEGIRLGKGEDFDGDKGFVLMFYKRPIKDQNDNVIRYDTIFGKETKTREESDQSIMNRALNLEYLDWIQPGMESYYSAKGDIPIDIFDEIVKREKADDTSSDFSLNTIEGMANQAAVIQGSGDAIGVTAVYNSMYSVLSGSTKELNLSETVTIGKGEKKKQIRITNLESDTYSVGIPSVINFDNYRSAKRLIGVMLNIIIDDPKDPRLYYLNVNKRTAGMAAFLMMANIKHNDIGTGPITETKAFADAKDAMEFIASPLMRSWNSHLEAGASKIEALKLAARKDPITKEQPSEQDVQMLQALILINDRLFNVTQILDAPFASLSSIDDYKGFVESFESVETGFNELMSPQDAEALFGRTSGNSLTDQAWDVFDETSTRRDQLPEVKVLKHHESDVYSAQIERDTRNLILATSLLDHVPTQKEVQKLSAEAIKALEKYEGNAFIDKLEMDDRGRISLNKLDVAARAEYTAEQIGQIKRAFASLPNDIQDAFVIHALLTRGTKGHFAGGYFDFISNDLSKAINAYIKRSTGHLMGMEQKAFLNALSDTFQTPIEEAETEVDVGEVVSPAKVTKPSDQAENLGLPDGYSVEKLETVDFDGNKNPYWNVVDKNGKREAGPFMSEKEISDIYAKPQNAKIKGIIESLFFSKETSSIPVREVFTPKNYNSDHYAELMYRDGPNKSRIPVEIRIGKRNVAKENSILHERVHIALMNGSFTSGVSDFDAWLKEHDVLKRMRREINPQEWSKLWIGEYKHGRDYITGSYDEFVAQLITSKGVQRVWEKSGLLEEAIQILPPEMTVVRRVDSEVGTDKGFEAIASANPTKGFSEIGDIIRAKRGFNGVTVNFNSRLATKAGIPVGARYHRKGPLAGTMTINPPHLMKMFADRAWTKARTPGVKPIDYEFKNASELVAFILEHEYQHSKSARRSNEDTAAYENRINQAALHNMGIKESKPDDGATYSSTTIDKDFTSWVFNEAGASDSVESKVKMNQINGQYKHIATSISKAQRPLKVLAAILSENHMLPDSLIKLFADSLGVPLKTVYEHVAFHKKELRDSQDKMNLADRLEATKHSAWLNKIITWEKQGELVNRQMLPDAMHKALKKAGMLTGTSSDGSAVHYATIHETFKAQTKINHEAGTIGYNHQINPGTQKRLNDLKIEKPLISLKAGTVSLSEQEADALLLLDLADAVREITKTIPSFETLPGNLQAAFVATNGLFQTALSSQVTALIESGSYLDAARLHMQGLIKARTMPKTAVDLALMDALIDYGALVDTIASLERGERPSPYLQTMKERRNTFDAAAQVANMGLDAILLDAGMKFPENLTRRNIPGRSAARQLFAVEKIKSFLGEEFALTSQFDKLLRISNGVPTLRELNTGAVELPPMRDTGTYSSLTIDLIDDAAGNFLHQNVGSKAMQRALLTSTRHTRKFMRKTHIEFNQMLRNTGGSAYIDPKTGKKIKATKDSKEMGRRFREALTILRETKPENWHEAVIIRSLDDVIPTSMTDMERTIMWKYITWVRDTAPIGELQKKDRSERGMLMLEQFAEELGKTYKNANRAHLFQMTKFLFGEDNGIEMLRDGQDKNVLDSYLAYLQKRPKPMYALDAVEEYETWRKENAPHLQGWNNGQAVDWAGKHFDSHREMVNEISDMLGQEWVREWKKTGYVPHEYKKPEDWEKPLITPPKESSSHEMGRKFATYEIAALNGLLPETLDFADLYKKYSNDIASVLAHRGAISLMALTSDDDGMPMMLFQGVDKLGIISKETANALVERMQEAMLLIDPEHKFKFKPGETGFQRLQSTMNQISPKKLGYTEVKSEFDSVDTVWVKEGAPVKIADHIFKVNKEFSNKWAQKTFDFLLTLNHLSKSMGIALSAFHPFALMESLIAIDGIKGKTGRGNMLLPWNWKSTVQQMRNTYHKTLLNPDMNMEWLDAGLDFEVGRAPDYDYEMINNKMAERAKALKSARDPFTKSLGMTLSGITRFKTATDKGLWEVMLPTLKLWSANRLYAEAQTKAMQDGRPLDPTQLREDISAYVNDAFGGQEWEQYIWANPHTRKWLHLLMFAPDWTLSALNISGVTHVGPMNKFFGSPTSGFHSKERMETYWPAFAMIVLVALPNMLQAMIYGAAKASGDDDEDDRMFAFDNEVGNQLSVDITPFIRMMGGKGYGKTHNRRVYLRWGKQAHEVFEGWLGGPEHAISTLLGKSSTSVKIVMEQALGMYKPGWNTPWQGRSFAETITDVDGKFWDGRAAGVLKKFVPMSVMPLLDEWSTPGTGKPTSFFAPARLGMSSYKAQEEIATVARLYAEGGLKKEFKGIPKYERKLENLMTDVLDAAEMNGYKRDKTYRQGIAKARMFYYSRFFEAMEKGDQKSMERNAEYLIRVGAKFDDFTKSVERRLETSDRELKSKDKRTLRSAWREGMKAAAAKKK